MTVLKGIVQPWFKVRSVNETSNGYVTKSATGTEPSGDAGTDTGASVQDIAQGTTSARTSFALMPYGVGADNATFSMRVLGWSVIGNLTTTLLWIPQTLFEVTCTLCTKVGVSGRELTNSERFVDTIAIVGTSGLPGISFNMHSPADNTIGYITASVLGAQKVECQFTTGASATSCNALFKRT
jgi:hypothetical protein